MARIFYRSADGSIYGVHPGAPGPSITLPAGVDWIDVAETPDAIIWPVNGDGRSGEKYARVQGGVLVAADTPAEIEAADAQATDSAYTSAGVTRAILHTLLDHENRLRALEGQGAVTAAQFKSGLKNRMR